MTLNIQESRSSRWILFGAFAAASLSTVQCGFGDTPPQGAGAMTSTTTNNPTQNMAGSGAVIGGNGNTAGVNPGGGQVGTAGTTPGAGSGTGGAGGGSAPVDPNAYKNYQVTGTWPKAPNAIPTPAVGTLKYTKVEIHNRFLAESCAIGDYNKDGNPDVSSGRRWYEGPFAPGMAIKEHIFRGGHDDLPRDGAAAEINTGVSDDWADGTWDLDGDGWGDIINIANCDVKESDNPNPKPAPQPKATAFWYKNPGAPANAAAESMWEKYSMHSDVRLEQHGLVDVDGDGYPEFYGACKECAPGETKGYYQAVKGTPTAGWQYHPVTKLYTFPFGGTGWLHGQGFGDVNGDGISDLLERGGAWINAMAAAPNTMVCTPGTPQAGCGWYQQTFYDGAEAQERGPSHMYAADIDGDGDADVVAADGAHHYGLSWYEQTAPGAFTKRQFMGSPADVGKYGVVFSEPHALEVADMDGDGAPDVITGKMRFAHPISYNDPDPLEPPVLYVFKTKRNTPFAANGGSVTMEPHLVDMQVGVGRKLSVGHANTDGIMDICIASKLGLYVFLGQ